MWLSAVPNRIGGVIAMFGSLTVLVLVGSSVISWSASWYPVDSGVCYGRDSELNLVSMCLITCTYWFRYGVVY